ncbi:MAG: hypothetical protein Q4G10_08310 [Bacteroidia bacterium]|nr:hypothetical protein [Bacteroidia bacterium]
MKKIFFALAIVMSMTFANAQQVKTKTPAAAKAAVEAAQAAASNAKKATKVATWLKLAQSYTDAYSAASGNGWIGAQAQELALVMGNQKPTSEENVVVNGVQYLKKAYATADYYFNEAGQLAVIKTTKPVVENALANALDAYKSAFKNDPKGTKTADIIKGIKDVSEKFVQEAYDDYTFGDMASAAKKFEAAAAALASEPCNAPDYEYVYDAGFAYLANNEASKAKDLFQQCLDNKFYGEGGEVYAKLADALTKLEDKAGSMRVLEEGFAAFPQSQGILIGLINQYVGSNENTDRLFSLLDNAKKNEPNNASLYYVEGNIYKELGKEEEALAAYDKCAQVDPAYEYGYVGKGLLLYNKAADLQQKAQEELDDTKYMQLAEQFEAALKCCIEPFEKALEITQDNKAGIAEYLKNATYRFRDADASYAEKYEKYAKMAAEQ